MSSHPQDRPMGAAEPNPLEPTQPMRVDDPPRPSGSHSGAHDPMASGDGGYVDVRDDAHDDGRAGSGGRGGSSSLDEAVHNLSQPDTRAKLLMAIAGMVLLTLIMTLVLLGLRLAEGGTEPVLVDGVPCLVEEGLEDGPAEGQAVLYCQR